MKIVNEQCDNETIKLLLVKLNGLLNVDELDDFEARLKQCWSKTLSITLADSDVYIAYIEHLTKVLRRQLGNKSTLVRLIEQIKTPKPEKVPKVKQYLQICQLIQEIYLTTKSCNQYLCIKNDITTPFDNSFFSECVTKLQTAVFLHQLDKDVAACLTNLHLKTRHRKSDEDKNAQKTQTTETQQDIKGVCHTRQPIIKDSASGYSR